MKASKFVEMFQEKINKYGDLPIVGGSILDDTVPSKISVLDADDCATDDPSEGAGFFIE